MASLTIELPAQEAQRAFNLRRWAEVSVDRELASIEGRVETDRYGHVVMSPPPAPRHGSFQVEIAYQLRMLLRRGRVLSECPISTADGVKAADVAWASPERMRELGDQVCFPKAPEICIEVLSPTNTEEEIREKMALYFDAGGKEVWLCNLEGEMRFFAARAARPLARSKLCPKFPQKVQLS